MVSVGLVAAVDGEGFVGRLVAVLICVVDEWEVVSGRRVVVA